ncbi:MAG: DUF2007 domain-containing protein [Verrucomicrobiota bacterium]
MKTIANVASLDEVQRIRIVLGSAGIEVFVPDEMTAGLTPHHFAHPHGVRVQVADEEERRAREVLEESLSD